MTVPATVLAAAVAAWDAEMLSDRRSHTYIADARNAAIEAAYLAGCGAIPAGTARVLSWDWRGQIGLDHLAAAVRELSGGRVRVTQVTTGSDQYAIVIANRELSHDEALAAYEAEWS